MRGRIRRSRSGKDDRIAGAPTGFDQLVGDDANDMRARTQRPGESHLWCPLAAT